MGHDCKIIRKALREEPYGYAKRDNQPMPIAGRYREIIEQWFTADKAVSKKQRHTARRIYHRLVSEHGCQVSEATIRRHVRDVKRRLGMSECKAFFSWDLIAVRRLKWIGALQGIHLLRGVRMKSFSMRCPANDLAPLNRSKAKAYCCQRYKKSF